MGISAVSASTGLDASSAAQSALKKQAAAKTGAPPAGGGGKPSGGAAPAAKAGGTSGTSNSSKIYDKRDTNKDGVVSYEEELAYAFQHPDETTTTQAATQGYNQQGKAANTASGAASTINLSA